MPNVIEKPRKRTLRLRGNRPKVTQQKPPPRAVIDGRVVFWFATVNGSSVING